MIKKMIFKNIALPSNYILGELFSQNDLVFFSI